MIEVARNTENTDVVRIAGQAIGRAWHTLIPLQSYNLYCVVDLSSGIIGVPSVVSEIAWTETNTFNVPQSVRVVEIARSTG